MNYISVSLFRKLIDHALAEGKKEDAFKDLPISIDSLHEVKYIVK